ncbi:unnamed protein product, partial [marine sediment metagenome]
KEGKADMVAIGRALIADPEFVLKAKEGRFDDIVPCIACNQGCLDMTFTGQPTFCLVNARTGRERELEIKPASKRKKVMVVGGGPAGMEAARVLATRGHTVSLYERSDKLGGQVNLAAVPPGSEEFANLPRYLSHQLEKLNVQVFPGREFTTEMVDEERPDAVVVATGALPITPQIAGIDRDKVVKAWDVLAGKAKVGWKVAVIGAGAVGCETAIFLAKEWAVDAETAVFLADSEALDPVVAFSLTNKGREVTILEMLDRAGRDIG